MKLYDIKEVQWNFKSEDIVSVKKKKYSRDIWLLEVKGEYSAVEIRRNVFELFQKQFPEWCINIEEDEVDASVPF